jgi:N-acetylglucosamine malate deacetylase 1
VMRPYPHPRSDEVVRALATFRGAQAGLNLAEAFETAYTALSNADEML